MSPKPPDDDTIINTLTKRDATLVVTCGCGCRGEETLPDMRAAVTTDNDYPNLYVRDRHAEGASLTEDPSLDSAIETVALAADEDALYAHCPDCGSFTRMTSPMEGTTGTDDGNRPAVFVSGQDALDSEPPGNIMCVALDEMLIDCPDCDGTAPRAEVVREGPDAPELGWRYCECPACESRWHVSAVEQSE